MTDIFREVDEEIRQDRLKALWNRYGVYIVGVCLGIIVAVGGLKGWQAYQKSVAEEAGAKYVRAMELARSGDAQQAAAALEELAASGPSGYAILARFQKAAHLAEQGDKAAAVTEYVKLSNSSQASDLLQGLADIRAAIILVDTGTRQEVADRVAKLNTRDNPWRNSARELLGLAAYKAGDLAEANSFYDEILGDPAAPNSVRQRAQVMASLLAPERKPVAAPEAAQNKAQ